MSAVSARSDTKAGPAGLPGLNNLPPDMRLQVFAFLTGAEAVSLLCTCSSWHALRSNERCCRLLCQALFGTETTQSMEIFGFTNESTWKYRCDVQTATEQNWREGKGRKS